MKSRRRYLRKDPCRLCGQPHWFHYFVGEYCADATAGLSIIDCDLLFHRFKKVVDGLGSRDVEHIMLVELKVEEERLGEAQRDTISVFSAALDEAMRVHGSQSGQPIGIKARPQFKINRDKKIVWHGAHLLRVPRFESFDGPFIWDNKPIDTPHLIAVLDFDNDPRNPKKKLDIDRRHKKPSPVVEPLFPLFPPKQTPRA